MKNNWGHLTCLILCYSYFFHQRYNRTLQRLHATYLFSEIKLAQKHQKCSLYFTNVFSSIKNKIFFAERDLIFIGSVNCGASNENLSLGTNYNKNCFKANLPKTGAADSSSLVFGLFIFTLRGFYTSSSSSSSLSFGINLAKHSWKINLIKPTQ